MLWYIILFVLVQLLDDSPAIQQLGLLIDPMRLSLRFRGHNSEEIDDQMCTGEYIRCTILNCHLRILLLLTIVFCWYTRMCMYREGYILRVKPT